MGDKQTLPPGSDEAIAKGCTCPALENYHGEGRVMYGKKPGHVAVEYTYNLDCPIHFQKETEDA